MKLVVIFLLASSFAFAACLAAGPMLEHDGSNRGRMTKRVPSEAHTNAFSGKWVDVGNRNGKIAKQKDNSLAQTQASKLPDLFDWFLPFFQNVFHDLTQGVQQQVAVFHQVDPASSALPEAYQHVRYFYLSLVEIMKGVLSAFIVFQPTVQVLNASEGVIASLASLNEASTSLTTALKESFGDGATDAELLSAIGDVIHGVTSSTNLLSAKA